MLRNDRQWHITQAGSPEELATFLTEHTWCPNQGFRLGACIILNDASGEAFLISYTGLFFVVWAVGTVVTLKLIFYPGVRMISPEL